MTETTVNPLLERVRISGTTYRLPSRGLFYENDEIEIGSSDSGEVVVNPMRTTEELLLSNPDKLFTGDAIEEVFQFCIPQIKKPRELLSKDVDYLMMALRLVSYGPTMQITFTHTCEEAIEHEYNVDLESILRKVREIDPTSLKSKFKLQLDNGQVLTLRPPRFDRVIKLYQSLSNFNEETQQETLKANVIDNLTDMIASVDDVDNPAFIAEWLDQLQIGFIHKINEFVEKSSDWGMDQNTIVTCQDCGEEVELAVPSNPISFFT